ncbi:MAG: 5'-nucleotidase C-terminal domain-containing protein, partial [Chloroflexi bacterium]|nr:5'-nucleotidase C-terminal domain-containing protein [Chloroflexota bacterium]
PRNYFGALVLIQLAILALALFSASCSAAEPTATRALATRVVLPTSTPEPVAPPQNFQLTILHNNDGESQLMNLGPGLENYGGAARFAAVVDRERSAVKDDRSAGSRGVIVVSSGDNFLAGAEFIAGGQKDTYFDALALDVIGYDAIVIGNHDFDFGPDVLAEFITQVSRSRVPFLSSNLDFSGEPALRDLLDSGRIAESMVIEGGRIGIIGATTPELDNLSSPRKVKVIKDVAGEVQAEVDRLTALGIDKIILISHMQDLDADVALLKKVSGIDIVVAGGGDQLLANECDLLIPGGDDPAGPYPMMAKDQRGNAVPVVTTPGQYSYLGKLVVTFDNRGQVIDIDRDASGPIRIAEGDNPYSVQQDFIDCQRRLEIQVSPLAEQMQREVISDLQAALDELTRPIADTEVALNAVEVEVRRQETNQGNLMADALLWQAARLALDYGAVLPDVAIQNGGGIRNDSVIPAGQIREVDTFGMAPFSNMVTVVEGITRSQFKEVLENAVSRAVTGDIDAGTGRFAQVAGFRFEWSESGTAQMLNDDGSVRVAGTRVQKVVLDSGAVIVGGGRVIPGDPLAVATVDFLARGGDDYPYRGAPFTALGVTYQQALANYIRFPDGLGGAVTAVDYPEGGEGRIKRMQ